MASAPHVRELVAAARSGNRRAVGRLISVVENDLSGGIEALQAVFPAGRESWITGLTGAPGVGKSTLADLLISQWREADKRVAVLAVDPTSPFTGGALLGDRIRMQRGGADEDVLVRSMATRGRLGGMAPATERVASLCAGLGYDEILIETVGVGQSEVDVAAAADTTIVVVTPGWGDGVQVAKAGLMEIGDVFVVNKADRVGAHDAVRELSEMLELAGDKSWAPPVVTTVATSGEGASDLVDALQTHRAHLVAVGDREQERRRRELNHAVIAAVADRADGALRSKAGQKVVAEVIAGETDPWQAASKLLDGR